MGPPCERDNACSDGVNLGHTTPQKKEASASCRPPMAEWAPGSGAVKSSLSKAPLDKSPHSGAERYTFIQNHFHPKTRHV